MSDRQDIPVDHPPCENVTKALARITATQWLIGVLLAVCLGLLPLIFDGRRTSETLSARMDVAEDRYKRNREDFTEIKVLLREMDAKINDLRDRTK